VTNKNKSRSEIALLKIDALARSLGMRIVEEECAACGGTGFVGAFSSVVECEECGGYGRVFEAYRQEVEDDQ